MRSHHSLKRFLSLALLSAALAGHWVRAAEKESTQTLTGVVVEVMSGDTLLLRTADSREVSLGVWGIDSPEINNQVGKRARKYTNKLVGGESVQVTMKARSSDGRILCQVIFGGSRDLAEELLKEGYAVWVTGLAPDQKNYEAAQYEAQEDRRGLWKAWLPSKGLQGIQ